MYTYVTYIYIMIQLYRYRGYLLSPSYLPSHPSHHYSPNYHSGVVHLATVDLLLFKGIITCSVKAKVENLVLCAMGIFT